MDQHDQTTGQSPNPEQPAGQPSGQPTSSGSPEAGGGPPWSPDDRFGAQPQAASPPPPTNPPPPSAPPPPGYGPQQGAAPPPPPPYGGGRRPDDRFGYPPPPGQKKKSGALGVLLGLVLLFGFGFFILMVGGSFILGGLDAFGGRVKGGISSGSGDIGLLRIEGPIYPDFNFDFWMESLQRFRDDSSIRGVVIRINSPGGTVGASQELYDQVLELKDKKKVYVSMGDVAASGGYYMAAAADKIFANRGTLTGSIGVISTMMNLEGLAENVGVDFEVIKSGRFKDAGSSWREMTDDERKMFDMLMNDTYEQFVDDVIREREGPIAAAFTDFSDEEYDAYQFTRPDPENSKTRDFLLQIADGRVYSGRQAMELGLVDELASLSDVIARLARDLKIKGKPEVYEPELKLTFFDMLNARVDDVVPTARFTHSTLQYRMINF